MALAVAYGWWAAARTPFTLEAHVATLAPAAALLWFGRRDRSATAPSEPSVPVTGLAAWGLLVGAVVGFELFNYLQQPRQAHPTMSSLVNEVDTTAVRRLLFVAWLGLGWHLVRK